MVNKVDSLDDRLIKLLQKDARQSSDLIAKQLKVSPATVRRRIRKLIQTGTIRIAAIVDPAKVGQPLSAVIALDVDHDRLSRIVEELASRPEVSWVTTTTGRYDMMAVARFPSTEDLSRFIQKELVKIEGIRDTETFVCLDIAKTIYKRPI